MKTLSEFNERGDLPEGIHPATLEVVLAHFAATPHRAVIARRLERIHALAYSTTHLARFIVFGSFITAKA